METIYKWLIWNMKRDPLSGGVGEVHYKVRATRESEQAIHSGSVKLTVDPTAESFLPYEQLTPEIVIRWVKDALDDSKNPAQQDIFDALDKTLDEKIAASASNGTPWN